MLTTIEKGMAFIAYMSMVLVAVVAKSISAVVPEVVVSGRGVVMMVSGGQVPLP